MTHDQAFDALNALLGEMQHELALREWTDTDSQRVFRAAGFRIALYEAIHNFRYARDEEMAL